MLLWVLSVLAIVIILALAGYAWVLTRKVQEQEANRAAVQAELEQQNQRQRGQRNTSIQLIAQGVLADQLSLTEAAIRISAVLDSIGISEVEREEFVAFYHLADATRHIPILAEWQKLKTKQRLGFDRQRQQLEADHKEFVLDAAQRILNRTF